jgi:hypothetical protein
MLVAALACLCFVLPVVRVAAEYRARMHAVFVPRGARGTRRVTAPGAPTACGSAKSGTRLPYGACMHAPFTAIADICSCGTYAPRQAGYTWPRETASGVKSMHASARHNHSLYTSAQCNTHSHTHERIRINTLSQADEDDDLRAVVQAVRRRSDKAPHTKRQLDADSQTAPGNVFGDLELPSSAAGKRKQQDHAQFAEEGPAPKRAARTSRQNTRCVVHGL